MRTTFSFEDDMELVQLARSYVDRGSRVSWTDIAHRMRRTGHTATALQGRLRTLMRTWGRDISRSPPPASSRNVEQAVTTIFADIPREVIMNDQSKPHRNAGEVMPEGISALLAEVGPLDGRDLFLDIGAGIGNVVAQVALGTTVYQAIGIELREDIHSLGAEMILRERTSLFRNDVAAVPIAYTPPFADSTVVYWNNVLFDTPVIEHVKDQLCGMTMIRFLVSCLNMCPRHREFCQSSFCASFTLHKQLGLPCSWKAELQQVFIYKPK
ncbi:hypothetical protein PHYSODRAFT_353125 [Phytophthora sojae]|uniref:Histone-lysine N-methyltransferase, H3 lysine-79 specific n=1 Tax=Phytophthora sojae (strain P6497) TaxID=1094619 RepID=G5AEF9_PHYSP|nr:hypothetical protein PHYSODRAFT_353125 [Phytophthora sojae]EGZ06561.1 hypothetical protein PHYSODRAFT_353125 [Phytophthora sojae]|eukprot:XP_009538458.1 hypothetical protein PHYSODRAFT_353125 [Phytophthora sojae]